MLEVQIENIIPVTEARDKFNQIVDAVENTDELYVITKNGKPASIMVGVHHLEKLTGESHEAVFGPTTPSNATPEPFFPPQQEKPATMPASTNDVPPMTPTQITPDTATVAPAPEATVSNGSAPGISFDSANAPSAQPASAAAGVPLDLGSTSDGGQALAPDAVMPAQTDASTATDPFALPNEPLDLPADTDVQSGQAGVTSQVSNNTQQPPAGQVQQ